jgi:hypothetical protein
MVDKTVDIFVRSLLSMPNAVTDPRQASLDVKDSSKPEQPPVNGSVRRENMPPPRAYPPRGPPPRHRPSNSDEERRRQQGKPPAQPNELDIFADPPDANRARERRGPPRRNSESSIREKPKDLDPEAEKKRRERKLRESRDGKTSTKSKKPNARLDIIDKLDVTSIYGTGCELSRPFIGR